VCARAYTEYLDRFSAAFIERRQAALQRFLDRIAAHPQLHKSDNLRLFLEAKAWVRVHIYTHTHNIHTHIYGSRALCGVRAGPGDGQAVEKVGRAGRHWRPAVEQ
jgi:hypothetical protein